ncbi:uncharacterized protein G2W53_014087 [Senna tora]|uniref:Uncharacterized protein n=1 Tax=Senna tora TaxID=362788 RepID=A0A834WSW2_9FABA|nr:uncharacterized protein G2W53_014087 [Senna tora]
MAQTKLAVRAAEHGGPHAKRRSNAKDARRHAECRSDVEDNRRRSRATRTTHEPKGRNAAGLVNKPAKRKKKTTVSLNRSAEKNKEREKRRRRRNRQRHTTQWRDMMRWTTQRTTELQRGTECQLCTTELHECLPKLAQEGKVTIRYNLSRKTMEFHDDFHKLSSHFGSDVSPLQRSKMTHLGKFVNVNHDHSKARRARTIHHQLQYKHLKAAVVETVDEEIEHRL